MRLTEILINGYYVDRGPESFKRAVTIGPVVLKAEVKKVCEKFLSKKMLTEIQYSKLLDALIAIGKLKEALDD